MKKTTVNFSQKFTHYANPDKVYDNILDKQESDEIKHINAKKILLIEKINAEDFPEEIVKESANFMLEAISLESNQKKKIVQEILEAVNKEKLIFAANGLLFYEVENDLFEEIMIGFIIPEEERRQVEVLASEFQNTDFDNMDKNDMLRKNELLEQIELFKENYGGKCGYVIENHVTSFIH